MRKRAKQEQISTHAKKYNKTSCYLDNVLKDCWQ